MKQVPKTFLVWAILILSFLGFYSFFQQKKMQTVQEVPFSQFLEQVNTNQLAEVEIKNKNHYLWQTKEGSFEAVGYFSDDVAKKLDEAKVAYKFSDDEDTSFIQSMFITWLPMVLLLVIFIIFIRQFQNGIGGSMNFGKSRAHLNEGKEKVTFSDVAGVEEAKEELDEIVDFLKDPKKFTKLGGRIPKGVLLMGPPGTGKTLLAKAIAGEAGVPFFSISGSDFVEMFVGVGAARVRDLFEQGKRSAPCIIFIDEIDAVGRHRGAGLGGGHDEREQTLNQLLVEMDGFESNEGVILIAATNRPDVLDPALLRAGRFDRRITVPRPDVNGRTEILKVHTRKVPLDEDVDLEVIARGTPGFSGADMESLVNEAALLGARYDHQKVKMTDFEEAKDKVLMGSERKSMIISEKEKINTAYHESGHAIVAKLLPNADPVHKVTIIPRGAALGLTQQLPTEDRYSYSGDYARDQLVILMGGRVAEELVLGEQTTGAGNDLKRATELARKMICEWGMSKKLGPLTFGQKEESLFLGRDISRSQDFSEETAKIIDEEVRELVVSAYNRAKDILTENRDLLRRFAEALLEYETVDSDDIDTLMRGEKLTRKPPMPKLRTSSKEQSEKKPLFDLGRLHHLPTGQAAGT